MARDLQFGEVTPPASLLGALNQARQGSTYARALAEGLYALEKQPPPAG